MTNNIDRARGSERFASSLSVSTLDDIDNLPLALNAKTIIKLIAVTTCSLLYGYHTSIVTGILLVLKPEDINASEITTLHKEVITTATNIGAIFGSIVSFPMADTHGRLKTLHICSWIFIASSIVTSLSFRLWILVLGRFIIGVAIGIGSQCVPLYLSEVSPAKIRGLAITINSMCITMGQLLAYLFVVPFINTANSWRFLVFLAILPAILFIWSKDKFPESPRWLALTSDPERARLSIERIYPMATRRQVNLKLNGLMLDSNQIDRQSGSYSSIASQAFKSNKKLDPTSKKALIIGCILMVYQQTSGFNAFIYYAPLIFQDLNVLNPMLPSIVVAATNVVFTATALYTVDKFGKRIVLLVTLWIVIIGLLLFSYGFKTNNASLLIISLIIYVAGYASGLGTIPWSSVEFLPTHLRSLGSSYISCSNWVSNSLISMTYLSLMKICGNEAMMVGFATVMFSCWFFTFFWYPEVKGLSLEEINKIFQNTGVDVHFIYRNYY
ncbi:hypothetical protein KAFR_0E03650 [Kazachstania africana CBS 2517]|uniref:Major facilitator superfamily (MFS) profile domain-containing protein n=1 Tax=Kazachstania africana (strain ATCC 22294 / BCRC 22015 / CBS 2517 / CECT 1963 / NBRC 1671 / NRRL Y-8276) TaxID=1071382 RepID=H2AVW6_KAZAF|nr:hypothetical protein KAFR_0E03650 [Kazachstania africana CBS 2517]CCF58516.1 hypothetical protein KAFR_0E03650 [Kazachstania africana CBS 2517]